MLNVLSFLLDGWRSENGVADACRCNYAIVILSRSTERLVPVPVLVLVLVLDQGGIRICSFGDDQPAYPSLGLLLVWK